MNQAVFSMKEFRPELLDEKKFRLETERYVLDQKREPFIVEKRKLEEKLSELNTEVKGNYLPDDRYREIVKEKGNIVREKNIIEGHLKELSKQLAIVNRNIDELKHQISKIPDDAIKTGLIELRDKYMAFAADTTRVSSMRAMSSKFTEEITQLLKFIK